MGISFFGDVSADLRGKRRIEPDEKKRDATPETCAGPSPTTIKRQIMVRLPDDGKPVYRARRACPGLKNTILSKA